MKWLAMVLSLTFLAAGLSTIAAGKIKRIPAWSTVVVLATGILVALAGTLYPLAVAKASLHEARAAASANDYERSLLAYTRTMKASDPDSSWDFLASGAALNAASEAPAVFERWIGSIKSPPEYSRAIKVFEPIVSMAPWPESEPAASATADAYLRQAKLFMAEKKYEEAVKSCTAVTDRFNSTPSTQPCLELLKQSYVAWGDQLTAGGDYTQALDKYAAARQLGVNTGQQSASALMAWGDALRQKKDYPGALQKYEQAVKESGESDTKMLHSRIRQTQLTWAKQDLKDKDYPAAAARMESILNTYPDSQERNEVDKLLPPTYKNWGDQALQNRDRDGAYTAYRSLLTRYPDAPETQSVKDKFIGLIVSEAESWKARTPAGELPKQEASGGEVSVSLINSLGVDAMFFYAGPEFRIAPLTAGAGITLDLQAGTYHVAAVPGLSFPPTLQDLRNTAQVFSAITYSAGTNYTEEYKKSIS